MTGSLQVFQALGTAQQRGCTTGENTLNHLRVAAEGGRTFSRIQHAEST